jgi:hypothetical protein
MINWINPTQVRLIKLIKMRLIDLFRLKLNKTRSFLIKIEMIQWNALILRESKC